MVVVQAQQICSPSPLFLSVCFFLQCSPKTSATASQPPFLYNRGNRPSQMSTLGQMKLQVPSVHLDHDPVRWARSPRSSKLRNCVHTLKAGTSTPRHAFIRSSSTKEGISLSLVASSFLSLSRFFFSCSLPCFLSFFLLRYSLPVFCPSSFPVCHPSLCFLSMTSATVATTASSLLRLPCLSLSRSFSFSLSSFIQRQEDNEPKNRPSDPFSLCCLTCLFHLLLSPACPPALLPVYEFCCLSCDWSSSTENCRVLSVSVLCLQQATQKSFSLSLCLALPKNETRDPRLYLSGHRGDPISVGTIESYTDRQVHTYASHLTNDGKDLRLCHCT